ncbi:MAG: nucleotidyltransferase family protein [Polyangiaceae bacterium]|nr:nucleotidyltransferase family protein [Polyangiaceae bacterium]
METEALLRYLHAGGQQPALDDLAGAELEARRLELEGALYAALRARDHLGLAPEALAQRLRRAHAEAAVHNLSLVGASSEIRAALAARGVDAYALKGVSLLEQGVITNLGARTCVDLDLLTRPADRAKVVSTLRELGFETSGAGGAPKHLPDFVRGTVIVEVHETAFWGRDGRRFGLDDLKAEPEPLAFALVHLVHHMFVSSILEPPLAVKTLADVVEIARFARAEEVLSRAYRLASLCRVGRELAFLLDASRAFEHGTANDSTRRFLEACREPTELGWLMRIGGFYWNGLFHSPPWFRRDLVASVLAPSRASMERIYGLEPSSWWVYPAYLLRPVHLTARALQRLTRAARHLRRS